MNLSFFFLLSCKTRPLWALIYICKLCFNFNPVFYDFNHWTRYHPQRSNFCSPAAASRTSQTTNDDGVRAGERMGTSPLLRHGKDDERQGHTHMATAEQISSPAQSNHARPCPCPSRPCPAGRSSVALRPADRQMGPASRMIRLCASAGTVDGSWMCLSATVHVSISLCRGPAASTLPSRHTTRRDFASIVGLVSHFLPWSNSNTARNIHS
jgi:hypothetical protein